MGEEIAVNAQMVADGYAYHSAQYFDDWSNGLILASLEAEAQTARRGVWANVNKMKPWNYRRYRVKIKSG